MYVRPKLTFVSFFMVFLHLSLSYRLVLPFLLFTFCPLQDHPSSLRITWKFKKVKYYNDSLFKTAKITL